MRLPLWCALATVLLVAVSPSATADETPDAERVTTITDERIAESSGLAVSHDDPSVLYTLNDSGNTAAVYSIDRATGDVVGVTTLDGYTLSDTEAIGVGADGTVWVADIGDNSGGRTDLALYALPAPGRGDETVTPERYPVGYRDGSHDAETLLVDPESGRLYIVTKGLVGGKVYRVPRNPSTERTNVLRPVRRAEMPGIVTDGSFTPGGQRVVLRTYGNAVVYDAQTWEEAWTTSLPDQRQGESLTVEPGGEFFLIGTEGLPSPILRIGLPAPPDPEAETSDSSDRAGQSDEAAEHDRSVFDIGLKILTGLVALLAVLIVWIILAARRSRRHGPST